MNIIIHSAGLMHRMKNKHLPQYAVICAVKKSHFLLAKIIMWFVSSKTVVMYSLQSNDLPQYAAKIIGLEKHSPECRGRQT